MKVSDVDRTPVAQDILCYNPKEGSDTWHVVVNHDANGYVDRIQCKMTGAIRKYKKKNKTPRPTRKILPKRATQPSSLASSQELEEQWITGIKNWADKVVSEYAFDKPFEKGDVFSHPNFGKGVTQSRRENKIDVLFKTGLKTLANKKARS